MYQVSIDSQVANTALQTQPLRVVDGYWCYSAVKCVFYKLFTNALSVSTLLFSVVYSRMGRALIATLNCPVQCLSVWTLL